MSNYNISHLTEAYDQCGRGEMQDDEALFLFALVRGCRISRVVEFGGLFGYSAKNFCEAVSWMPKSQVYSVDIAKVPKVAENLTVLRMSAGDVRPEHLDNAPIGLVFFDCHHASQNQVMQNIAPLITDETVIAIHDTNLIYDLDTGQPRRHQPIECDLANSIRAMGYDAFSIRTRPEQHCLEFPLRTGLTILQKFRPL